MSERSLKTFNIPYRDSDLPLNDLSIERTEEIEKKVMPLLMEELEKFRLENPEYFKEERKK